MDSIESAKKALEDAKRSVDQTIGEGAKVISQGAAYANVTFQDAYKHAMESVDLGQTYIHQGLQQYREVENAALSTAVAGLTWGAANPYVAYPAAGAATLLLFPFTRRILYRQTIGRFQNPQSVVRSCEGRVKGIASKLEDYGKEVEKLQDRMTRAEADYKSGLSKLKATRLELQRLSGVLSKGEKSATGVVQELRTVSPTLENVLQLRGEAAGHAAALRTHKSKVDKWVNRIASMDI